MGIREFADASYDLVQDLQVAVDTVQQSVEDIKNVDMVSLNAGKGGYATAQAPGVQGVYYVIASITGKGRLTRAACTTPSTSNGCNLKITKDGQPAFFPTKGLGAYTGGGVALWVGSLPFDTSLVVEMCQGASVSNVQITGSVEYGLV